MSSGNVSSSSRICCFTVTVFAPAAASDSVGLNRMTATIPVRYGIVVPRLASSCVAFRLGVGDDGSAPDLPCSCRFDMRYERIADGRGPAVQPPVTALGSHPTPNTTTGTHATLSESFPRFEDGYCRTSSTAVMIG